MDDLRKRRHELKAEIERAALVFDTSMEELESHSNEVARIQQEYASEIHRIKVELVREDPKQREAYADELTIPEVGAELPVVDLELLGEALKRRAAYCLEKKEL